MPVKIGAVKHDPSARRPTHSAERIKERALTCSARSDDADKLTAGKSQIDVKERSFLPELPCEINRFDGPAFAILKRFQPLTGEPEKRRSDLDTVSEDQLVGFAQTRVNKSANSTARIAQHVSAVVTRLYHGVMTRNAGV